MLLDFEKDPLLYDISCSDKKTEKDELLKGLGSSWARLQTEDPGFAKTDLERCFQKEMHEWMIIHGAMVFEEMIFETLHYLKGNPHSPEFERFDHILVDEYQDFNKAEQTIIDLMSREAHLAIIGDDDQSIYAFRHAHPEGIRGFPKNHRDCEDIKFDRCRRCPQKVVSMASALIAHNSNRTLGDLEKSEDNPIGGVSIFQFKTLEMEIKGISKIVKDDIDSGIVQKEDMLILCPSGYIGKKFVEAFENLGVEARSYFKESAIEHKTLRYNFEIFTLIVNPKDKVALRYLLGGGVSDHRCIAYRELMKATLKDDKNIFDFLNGVVPNGEETKRVKNMAKYYKKIKEEIKNANDLLITDRKNIVEVLLKDVPTAEGEYFQKILTESLKEIKPDTEYDEWLKELYSGIIDRLNPIEDTFNEGHLRVMSLHASKGLSAKYVVVTSVVNGLIPKTDKGKLSLEQEEEGRRLFYVAITRCKGKTEDFCGRLMISSFQNISTSDAAKCRIYHGDGYRTNTPISKYIADFDGTAPPVIKK